MSTITDELDPYYRMRRIEERANRSVIHETFTLKGFLDECQLPEPTYSRGASTEDPESSWVLGTSYDQALDMVVTGWCDMPYQTHDIATLGNRRAIKAIKADYGEELDVSAYLSGDDKPWFDYRRTGDLRQGGKIVRLASNVSALASNKPEAMVKRGLATMALVESLEASGHNVELWAVMRADGTGYGSYLDYRCDILVKPANDYTNRARALFFLAHPAVLRRLSFRLRERLPERDALAMGSSGSGGYGRTTEINDHNFDVYMPSIDYSSVNYGDKKESERWIREQVTALN